MLEQRRLDLHAVNVLAAADHHVLGPVDDVDEALVVDTGDVAGVQPAAGERLGGRRGLVPVTLHDVGALDPQLADRPRREVVAQLVDHLEADHRYGGPHAVGMGHVVLSAVERRHRRRLGEAVAVGRDAAGEQLLDPAHELGRRGRAAIADVLHAGDVALREVGRLEHLPDHRRDPAEDRDPLSFDQLERALRVPLVHDHELPPGRGVGHQHRMAARGVEERHREQVRVLRARAQSLAARLPARPHGRPGLPERQRPQVAADVAMGAERALGLAGRARRVEDRRVVLGLERHDGHLGLDRSPIGAEDLLEAIDPGSALPGLGPGDDHPGSGPEAFEPLAVDEHHSRPAVAEPVLELGCRPPRVEGHDDRTRDCGRPEGQGPFGVVAHRDGDPVALLDAEVGGQPPSQRGDLTVVLVERRAFVLVDEERRVAVQPAQLEDASQRRRCVLPYTRRHSADLELVDLEELARRGEGGIYICNRRDHGRSASQMGGGTPTGLEPAVGTTRAPKRRTVAPAITACRAVSAAATASRSSWFRTPSSPVTP